MLSPLELPLRLVEPVEDVDLLAPQVGVRGRVAVHPLRLQGQPLGALHHKHSHPHTLRVNSYKEHIAPLLSTSGDRGTGSGYGMQQPCGFYLP